MNGVPPQIHQASNERIVVRGGNRPAIVAQLQQWVHYRGSVLMHGSNQILVGVGDESFAHFPVDDMRSKYK